MKALTPGDAAAFATLKTRVIARTGHHYYADKDDQLWERVADRMAVLGIATVGDYARRLDDAAADEWARIESAVTINETFFFRFSEQFEAMRQTVLPALIARRGGDRRLRIWSVGCSTGAEPYSIAILLHRLLGPRLADWQIEILGTDIDGDALDVARAGLFGDWALRTMAAGERSALFVGEGTRFRLKPEYRAMVRFARHNMMTLLEDGPTAERDTFDLILCRNVLIYFRQDVVAAMVGALALRTRPDGYLMLGHAEPNPALNAVATPVDAGGVLAYRRLGSVAEVVPVVAVPVQPVPVVQRVVQPVKRVVAKVLPKVAQFIAPAVVVGDDRLDAVRRYLSTDDAAAALAQAEAAVAAIPRDPVAHYLGALAAAALGQASVAERGYRRALYLDGDFAMAHYLLGRQLMGEGRVAEGRRSLANAANAAALVGDDAVLREGDGMTAADLIAAVRHALQVAA
ncbi:CheR family methyltransferase [Sphingomonas arantia]|uniref:protein-glutamate O-methyltransferase n=1 Tax=Sphingomonas arantia TaxID=1460676 RepID=A0ABW4U1Z6_9SPHN